MTPAEVDAVPLTEFVEAYLTGAEALRHATYWSALGGFVGTISALSAAFGGNYDISDVLEAWLGGVPMRQREEVD